MSFSKILLTLSVIGLSGCASVVETPNQEIEITSLGAQHVRCDLHIGDSIYPTELPQTLTIRKTHHPIEIECLAPGNRSQRMLVEPAISKYVAGNAVTAGAGAAYDFASGAMFNYPERIVVDFTQESPAPHGLPAHYAQDAYIEGYDGIEHMGSETLETQTSLERQNRSQWINERERRKGTTAYGVKSSTARSQENIPQFMSPYTPEPTFPGTTSF